MSSYTGKKKQSSVMLCCDVLCCVVLWCVLSYVFWGLPSERISLTRTLYFYAPSLDEDDDGTTQHSSSGGRNYGVLSLGVFVR